MFIPGKVYRRRELHERYGGQEQGGISTPSRYPFIMLFTGKSGLNYGYSDGWTDDGLFLYTGEGQRGDMVLQRGNRAILDHVKAGKDLHLFEQTNKGYVRYIGQMVCAGYQDRMGPDVDGNLRQILVFELSPLEAFTQAGTADEMRENEEERRLWQVPVQKLKRMVAELPSPSVTPRERLATVRLTSHALRVYVLRRADGICEGCREPAPFQTEAGSPYLELHYIGRLSDGGPDDPRRVVALCPNCHRRAHYGAGKDQFNRLLGETASARETKADRNEPASGLPA